MGKSSKEALGAAGKTDALLFDPDDLTIVTDKKHPLYDERHDPDSPHFIDCEGDDRAIRNVMHFGVLETIVVRKEGVAANGKPVTVVAEGRSRVRWARAANKRLHEMGKETLRVPALSKRGDDAHMMGVMISGNEIRRDDSPIVKARKVQRYLDTGKTEEEAATAFGVAVSTVKNYLSLLDCSAPVQHAVERGELPTSVAKKLSGLPRDAQKDALDKMRSEGATKGKRAQAAVERAAGRPAKKPTTALGRRTMVGIAKRLREVPFDGGLHPSDCAALVLEYVTGASPRFAEDYRWHATGDGEAPKAGPQR